MVQYEKIHIQGFDAQQLSLFSARLLHRS